MSAIGVLIAKVDANTELTHCVSRKLDVHAESHKAIDRHMEDVRRVLFEKDGVLDQVRDCKNFREGQQKAGPAGPAGSQPSAAPLPPWQSSPKCWL